MSILEEQLARIPPSERILLLPHCLRHSETCQGKYSKKHGLECCQCSPDCAVNHLSQAAIKLGYKGVCVAPGGRLAVNYVKENKPRAIVAVACEQELEEGIHGVQNLPDDSGSKPLILVVPLLKDGCVDTEVDETLAMEKIALGCPQETSTSMSSSRGTSALNRPA